MAEDKEVLRMVWEGQIPVCFNLAIEDVQSIDQPEPYYVMVPRLTYFPLVTDKMYRHFVNSIETTHGEMWLEYEGQALKWHYPVGVLYDLYARDLPLPWNITVHFSNFPESEVMHCINRDTVEAHYMASLKEADWLKHRGQIITQMQKKDHKQLWMGLVNMKFEQFWAVNKKLMERGPDHDGFKHIPFRIYQPDQPYIQRLVKPVSEEGHPHTFKDILNISGCLKLLEDTSTDYEMCIQGISLPLETPLQWMSEHLSYPDNFIHITVTNLSSR